MQWEYKLVELDGGGFLGGSDTPSEDRLNELGEDRWELVATLASDEQGFGSTGTPTTVLVFKRPRERQRAETTRTAPGSDAGAEADDKARDGA